MPRRPRTHVPGGVYHIILRGNAQRDIFHDREDRELWQRLVCNGVDFYGVRVHAYCWMTNHIHIAAQAGSYPTGSFVGVVAARYAKAYNKKYGRSGHLFERRHRAILVGRDEHLLELVRYIHNNPVRAGMVSELASYDWSSHNAYLGQPAAPFLTTSLVLSILSSEKIAARRQYVHFMRGSSTELVVDQLCHEAAANVNSFEGGHKNRVRCDSSQKFIGESLDQLIERVCEAHSVNEAALASLSRDRQHAKIRALIALEAIETGLSTVTEMARRFNRSQPTMSRAVNRLRRRQQKL